MKISQIPLSPSTGYNTIGVLGDPTDPAIKFANVLSTTIGALTIIAAIFFVFKLITGSIAIISAGGDKGKLAKAREDITMGLIGFVITISAMFIVDLVASILGIQSLLDINATFESIAP